MLTAIDPVAAIIIPFIVQFLKKWIPTRFAPVLAFVIGAIYGAVEAIIKQEELILGILKGVVIGGTATGLYDLTKVTILNK